MVECLQKFVVASRVVGRLSFSTSWHPPHGVAYHAESESEAELLDVGLGLFDGHEEEVSGPAQHELGEGVG